jgi:hypothetical protein
MTMSQIVVELCRREGKKKQVNIAQMREIVANLCDILVENHEAVITLMMNGAKRDKKKSAKKKK